MFWSAAVPRVVLAGMAIRQSSPDKKDGRKRAASEQKEVPTEAIVKGGSYFEPFNIGRKVKYYAVIVCAIYNDSAAVIYSDGTWKNISLSETTFYNRTDLGDESIFQCFLFSLCLVELFLSVPQSPNLL